MRLPPLYSPAATPFLLTLFSINLSIFTVSLVPLFLWLLLEMFPLTFQLSCHYRPTHPFSPVLNRQARALSGRALKNLPL